MRISQQCHCSGESSIANCLFNIIITLIIWCLYLIQYVNHTLCFCCQMVNICCTLDRAVLCSPRCNHPIINCFNCKKAITSSLFSVCRFGFFGYKPYQGDNDYYIMIIIIMIRWSISSLPDFVVHFPEFFRNQLIQKYKILRN